MTQANRFARRFRCGETGAKAHDGNIASLIALTLIFG